MCTILAMLGEGCQTTDKPGRSINEVLPTYTYSSPDDNVQPGVRTFKFCIIIIRVRLVHLPAVRLEKWGEGIGDIENTKVVGFDCLLCFFTL